VRPSQSTEALRFLDAASLTFILASLPVSRNPFLSPKKNPCIIRPLSPRISPRPAAVFVFLAVVTCSYYDVFFRSGPSPRELSLICRLSETRGNGSRPPSRSLVFVGRPSAQSASPSSPLEMSPHPSSSPPSMVPEVVSLFSSSSLLFLSS